MTRRARPVAPPRIAVIGNVAEDRVGDSWVPGGPSLYSARVAQAMGARVMLVSHFPPGYDRSVLTDLDIRDRGRAPAPRFENTYTPAGDRTQRLLAEGRDLAVSHISGFDALLLAPAYRELDAALLSGLPRVPLMAFALQGFLRDVDPEGRIIPRAQPVEFLAQALPAGSFAFFSDEDTPDPSGLAEALAAHGVTALVTRGYRPVELYRHGAPMTRFPVAPAQPADPTGAGDCFAAACVVRLAEGARLEEAVHFALAAAALMVEGVGIAGIPTRAAVEARLAQVAA